MKGKKGFQPGASGNPGGRPKEIKSLIDQCRAFVDVHGIPALIKLAKNESDPKLQLATLIYITNRAYGCPTDKLAVEGKITLEQIIAAAHKPKE